MTPLEVIIVEDDPMVAQINASYLAKVPGLRLAGVFRDGRSALAHLRSSHVDLAVLDVYMPELDGLELLRVMRREGSQAEVVMVTAANDAKQVDELLRLGIVDYLIKPFTESRFIEAMRRCLARRLALGSEDHLNQQAIDSLLGGPGPAQAFPVDLSSLPKGLQAATIELVLNTFHEDEKDFLDCEILAARAGLSKVTVRRYLNHLAESGAVESQVDYDTGGRPSFKYRLRGILAARSPQKPPEGKDRP